MHMRCLIFCVSICLLVLTGCAEGPFWRLGHYNPWATQKWEQEEQFADTLFERKRELNQKVQAAVGQNLATQNKCAEEIAEVALKDPFLLMRLQAVRTLGELDCPSAHECLQQVATDPEPRVRLMAVEAWRNMSDKVAVPALQNILGSDTNVDVRLAATRALGDFSESPAVAALQIALADPDPAIRMRATESMARATGESFGKNVRAWREYADNYLGQSAKVAGRDENIK